MRISNEPRPATRRRRPPTVALVVGTLVLLAGLPGCAGLKETLALSQVAFRFDRISDPAIVGMPISKLSRYEDLSIVDVGRLALAVSAKDVPLDLVVHVEGTNPSGNNTQARLVKLDWSYLVEDREIVAGSLQDEYVFPPGQPKDVPLRVRFNLVDAFGSDGKVLFDTALVLAGQQTSTKRVTLRLTPTIETALGPIRYPVPVSLDLAAAK